MPRRKERGEDFDYVPKKLSQKQKAMLRLKFDGWLLKDIAEATGYTAPWISALANSSAGMAYLAELEELTHSKLAEAEAGSVISSSRKKVRERLDVEAETSLQRLLNIRDGCDDERVVASVSMDLLDRAGIKEPEKVEVSEKVLASPSLLAALAFLQKRIPVPTGTAQ